MTKEEFFDRLIWDSDEQKEWANFYIMTKGLAFHIKVAKHIGFDINDSNSKVEWKRVAHHIGYDKKLRYVIYKYIATLEEYIRAYISNKYEDKPDQDFWIEQEFWCKGERTMIQLELAKQESISAILEQTDLGFLIKQVKALPFEDKKALFEDVYFLNKNLNALRELRNAVSHHVFLQAHQFKWCTVDGIDGKDLTHQIKNLRQLLPREYRIGKNGEGGITTEINECRMKNAEGLKYINLLEIEEKDIVVLNVLDDN